jgi:hypothetical protein
MGGRANAFVVQSSVFALVDALTRLAGKLPNGGDRTEADERASSLLALAV